MNGEALYGLYRKALRDQDVLTDDFEELEEDDRVAWNRVAEQVRPREEISGE